MERDSLLFSDKDLEKLKSLSIEALILFGSRAQGLAGPKSDFDFGIIVQNKNILYSFEEKAKLYNTLYDLLSAKINQLVNIDIVFLEVAPAELQAHVMKYGRLLFEAKTNVFSNYRADIIESYSDFSPLRKVFEKNILSRIK